MQTSVRGVAIWTVAFLVALSPACAQSQFPSTPAGRALTDWVKSFNSVDPRAISTFHDQFDRQHATGFMFMISVPVAGAVNHITGTNWERTGVEPDVKCSAEDALITAERRTLTLNGTSQRCVLKPIREFTDGQLLLASGNCRDVHDVGDSSSLGPIRAAPPTTASASEHAQTAEADSRDQRVYSD
jgi:hypothetical protein